MEIHHISILLLVNVIQYGKHISILNVNLRAIGRWFDTNEKTITSDVFSGIAIRIAFR